MTCRSRRTILNAGEVRNATLLALRRFGFTDQTLISLGRRDAKGKSRYLTYPGCFKSLRVSDHPIAVERHRFYADVAHTVVVNEPGTVMDADRIAWLATQRFHAEVERRFK